MKKNKHGVTSVRLTKENWEHIDQERTRSNLRLNVLINFLISTHFKQQETEVKEQENEQELKTEDNKEMQEPKTEENETEHINEINEINEV